MDQAERIKKAEAVFYVMRGAGWWKRIDWKGYFFYFDGKRGWYTSKKDRWRLYFSMHDGFSGDERFERINDPRPKSKQREPTIEEIERRL